MHNHTKDADTQEGQGMNGGTSVPPPTRPSLSPAAYPHAALRIALLLSVIIDPKRDLVDGHVGQLLKDRLGILAVCMGHREVCKSQKGVLACACVHVCLYRLHIDAHKHAHGHKH